jgi:hypothetical protein
MMWKTFVKSNLKTLFCMFANFFIQKCLFYLLIMLRYVAIKTWLYCGGNNTLLG